MQTRQRETVLQYFALFDCIAVACAQFDDLEDQHNYHPPIKMRRLVRLVYPNHRVIPLVGKKKSKSVFDFFTYSRKTGFSFSYEEVEALD